MVEFIWSHTKKFFSALGVPDMSKILLTSAISGLSVETLLGLPPATLIAIYKIAMIMKENPVNEVSRAVIDGSIYMMLLRSNKVKNVASKDMEEIGDIDIKPYEQLIAEMKEEVLVLD